MKVCLSFDDGRDDAYYAFKILKEKSLVASFHVATGFIDGSFVTDSFGIGRKPLTIEQLKEMKANGMDISSHGDRHVMEDIDFSVSVKKLREWNLVDKRKKIGFSVPNSQFTEDELKRFISNNEVELSYIRVGRSPKCYSFFSKVNYALYHLFHFQCFYNSFNKHNLIQNIDKYHLYSLVLTSDVRVKNVIKFIEKSKNKNAVLVIMVHSVIEKPQNKWEYSSLEFKKLVDYLSKNTTVVTLEELVNDAK